MMSTNLPVNWNEELAKSAKEIAKAERPSVSGISLKAGVMQLAGTPVPGNKLNCVIVASLHEQKYFPDRYDPNKIVAPACFSFSESGEDMAPHSAAKDKQSETCASCQHYQWGSDPNGGRGKACKAVRRLALLPASALLSEGVVNSSEMAILTVPVTSVRNWGNYVNQLSNEHARPPWAVLTEVSVVPDAKTQFKVLFTMKGIVSDEYLAAMQGKLEAAETVLSQPYEYTEEQEKPKDNGKKKKY
jgi:hypothetical protein